MVCAANMPDCEFIRHLDEGIRGNSYCGRTCGLLFGWCAALYAGTTTVCSCVKAELIHPYDDINRHPEHSTRMRRGWPLS